MATVLVYLSNTLNRALIFYVYWNYANLCYIKDALHKNTDTLNADESENSGIHSQIQIMETSDCSLNNTDEEDVRKYIPKEYNMTMLSA